MCSCTVVVQDGSKLERSDDNGEVKADEDATYLGGLHDATMVGAAAADEEHEANVIHWLADAEADEEELQALGTQLSSATLSIAFSLILYACKHSQKNSQGFTFMKEAS